MADLKKDASPAFIETLRAVEAQADESWRALSIIGNPCDVAVWAMLTGGIAVVEREQAARGSNTPHFDAMLANLGRLLPIAVRWALAHGQAAAPSPRRNWTHELGAAVEQAMPVATAYSHFEVCFQAFHKNRLAVDVLSPTLLRFITPGGERDRQVSAYQKGHRPREGRFTGQRAAQRPQAPAVEDAFRQVLRGCLQTGARSFAYGDPWDLWRELLPEYRDRVNAIARRAGALSVGPYRLGEFNEFYGAVIAICATHDHLCYLWHRVAGAYPIESAIMLRAASEWRDVLSALSGVSPEKCQAMLSDLTFSVTRSIDLHVWPFVPLDPDNEILALPPPFPLHSNHDENILRVCSQRRPQIYDATSLEKEAEMRALLRDAGRHYGADGPIPLPHPVPDIDLIAADESSSTVVIAELKWIRKPLRPAERADRDADVLKGVGQLTAIQQFRAEAPGHLSELGKLPRPLNQYEHVYYLLVARDHWPWVEPRDRIAIVEFDTFRRALERTEDLHVTVSDLLRYEWLPVEGRDFFVQYDRATANGVSIESQVFYSTHPA